MRLFAVRGQEIGRDHRRYHTRDGKAHQHREHHGHPELDEELARDAGHQRDGQEDRDDRHRRRHNREADFVGGVDRSLIGRLAHTHMSDDILDLDDRVVDQYPGDKAERQQRQAVERKAHQIHEPEGRNGRQRDRHRADHRGAPVAQEQEDDDDGEHRAFDHRGHRAAILFLRIFGAGEEDLELHLGVVLLDLRQLFHRLVMDADVRRALRLFDREGQHLTAVDLRQITLFGITVGHLGHVRKLDRPAVADRNARFAELECILRVAEDADRLFRPGNFGAPARRVQIDLTELLVHLARGQAIALHPRGIEDHADFAVDPARTAHLAHARDRQQLFSHGIVDEPRQLLERHVGRLDREIGDRTAGDIDTDHLRLENPVGQIAANLRNRLIDVIIGAVDRCPDRKLHHRTATALADIGGEFIDPADAAHRSFDALRHLRFEFRWRSARLRDDDLHRREFDIGIVIDVHPVEADDPRQQQQREQDDRRHRIADAPGGDVAKAHDSNALVRSRSRERLIATISGSSASPCRRR